MTLKAMGKAFEDSATLEVLDTYRSLSDRESDRVFGFVTDAKQRDSDEEEERAYTTLENFWTFVKWHRSGYPINHTCLYQDLTEDQYHRYVRAWESIQAVREEAEAKFGPEEAQAAKKGGQT